MFVTHTLVTPRTVYYATVLRSNISTWLMIWRL